MNVGRITYINCYPVYGAVDRGIVPLDANIVSGVPTHLNNLMASGMLDVSVVSAVEYARDSDKYLLLPDLAISCDGEVRSVMLFSTLPAESLTDRTVMVSRSSMTSVALLDILFEGVWNASPQFVPGDAELTDIDKFGGDHTARLVIGDAALLLSSQADSPYPYVYDLGKVWKDWTGLPFVFAVWVAQRTTLVSDALRIHAQLIESRNWGIANLDILALQAHETTGISPEVCRAYLSELDYGLSYPHLAGLTEFFRRLVARGKVPDGTLSFLTAA